MRELIVCLFCLLLAFPPLCYGSDSATESDMEALLQRQFIGKIFELRNWRTADKQIYAADGSFDGNSKEGAWIRYGIISVEKLKLEAGHLEIEGHRMLIFRENFSKADQPQWPRAPRTHPTIGRTNEAITLRINFAIPQPIVTDVKEALQKVFISEQELLPRIPRTLRADYVRLMSGDWSNYQKPVEQEGLAFQATTPPSSVTGPDHNTDILPPKFVHLEQPQYDEVDRRARISGVVALEMIIDKDGKPKDLQIVGGLTPGLEENAVDAVQRWRFSPAMKDGHPFEVPFAIEVRFQIR